MALLGSMVASLLREYLPLDAGHGMFGLFFLRSFVAVHVNNFASKHNALMLMAQKLCSFARGSCGEDNVDSISHQEVLLPGHLLGAFIKEKLEESLGHAVAHMRRDAMSDRNNMIIKMQEGIKPYISKILGRYVPTIGTKMTSFIGTGTLISSSGLDLQQTTGFAIIAERLNKWRYLSHFRSIHRGQFFTTMKTTSVRKLLPDSWGFLCPAHTPDGAPCGLLSHLAARAHVVCSIDNTSNDWQSTFIDILVSLGMSPINAPSVITFTTSRPPICAACAPRWHRLSESNVHVSLDGAVLGSASNRVCAKMSLALRRLKVKSGHCLEVSAKIEIALITQGFDAASPFPGLYLFSQPARLVRPVLQCGLSPLVELVGPFEQATLQIACNAQVLALRNYIADTDISTHAELDPTNMLSILASLTPFSDFNQSPRNMYQCQMGKQTMGIPSHSLHHCCDNKSYRILTPQSPVVCTKDYHNFDLDIYAQGTNSIVAVIAHTGYDMEDAMIINKSAYERGFGHGHIYKTLLVDLIAEAERKNKSVYGNSVRSLQFGTNHLRFSGDKSATLKTQLDAVTPSLGVDGLPAVGQKIRPGEPLWYASFKDSCELIVGIHKDTEAAYVDAVCFIGCRANCQDTTNQQKVSITLRFPRNPVIGDKFSSRHGQKGVLSILWPEQNMPFSESGLIPDIIINPHAFPSRMTIGMLIESMAGKTSAVSGHFQDGTPFVFPEDCDAINHFGTQLCAAGFIYHGSEPVYSGCSGLLMHVEIFLGVVYYQRLRHMVSDKSQVRGTGPVHLLTQQPVKGRKRHGGIRLGEMERDALLAHGTAFLLYDRLLLCSDIHPMCVCANPRCGSVLSGFMPTSIKHQVCLECNGTEYKTLAVPYVYRYLNNELAGMNILLAMKDR
jgi:DNA-directed RNA polymerase I subunit RPA2